MKVYNYDAIVIGSGAAGYNAAIRLKEQGVKVAMVTEGIRCGTSRNTGSDKQTYYKLGLGGSTLDSVGNMAQNLFNGGCVDGDNALCEAALSSRCFLNLCELGVPFPTNRYGEYVGYKTDHDPFARATSAGPLTSKFMTEALQKKAERMFIDTFDGYYATDILKADGRVCGLLCDHEGETVAFRCPDIILATGGPAGIYADSVFPECHTGSSGLAIAAGAKMQNLSLWQYGLASIAPRWNVSGTYMQVLPRFVSIDEQGIEHDFLWETFKDKYEGLLMVFLKGYQWPFDPKKAEFGSTRIDLLVYRECVEKKRRVYLDFTKNPCDFEFEKLDAEAFDYLDKAGATFGTPIERLAKMNQPAIDLYKEKGLDITKDYLEIALCAQHNNGGIAVDLWWQTSIRGLFAAGECAGTHGISRPGGSALNAGQVGSLRAAQYIAAHPNAPIEEDAFMELIADKSAKSSLLEVYPQIESARRKMSDCAAAVRDIEKIRALLKETCEALETVEEPHLRDVLLTQGAVLTAMEQPQAAPSQVQQVTYKDGKFDCFLREVRPLDLEEGFFENIWRGYRENKNIY